ncbi:hypothetical protein ElyMa_006788700 [Elysia marginata]|uniref:Uncharacterized protein n=1 Tax=Elysia marginata TaxID=1093978 RepID=A0AAV4J6G4_9GAST|nr:hypothetical protein ElyMa_006788700 [Elysia marginata]
MKIAVDRAIKTAVKTHRNTKQRSATDMKTAVDRAIKTVVKTHRNTKQRSATDMKTEVDRAIKTAVKTHRNTKQRSATDMKTAVKPLAVPNTQRSIGFCKELSDVGTGGRWSDCVDCDSWCQHMVLH